ncbi:hypothetical protein HMPREF3192_01183 [Atopobium deltae]|uniref:Uncharacterized protein n=1 Tax=Atopobium deltae TaxID=1393034 RepID=A0A133XR90_9ACTN|nr:hypothetical protein HMPREF3192_01183 [Atopobium deltae]
MLQGIESSSTNRSSSSFYFWFYMMVSMRLFIDTCLCAVQLSRHTP